MTDSNEILAYWLIPAEPASTYFQSLISQLAAQFDAPEFEPHLTLYVTKAGQDDPKELLGQALPDFQSLYLSFSGIDYSDKFTKTLFVQFQSDEELAKLNEKLRSASAARCEYQVNPHLSLIYKKLPPETKRQIANSIRLPFTQVKFDSIKAIFSPARIETPNDVHSWRIVTTGKLEA